MDNLNIVAIVLSSIAIVLSVAVAVIQLRDYFQRLEMRVTYIHNVFVRDTTALIFVRLSFVNYSSKGKVVSYIVPTVMPNTAEIGKYRMEVHLDSGLAVYRPSIDEEKFQMPISEALLPPLDIPPLQSVSKWYCVELNVLQHSPEKLESPIPICFVADVVAKNKLSHKVAEAPVIIYPLKRMDVNMTSVPFSFHNTPK